MADTATVSVPDRLAQLRASGLGRLESMRALQAEFPDLELVIPDTEDELDARHADASDDAPDLEDDEDARNPGSDRWHDLGAIEETDHEPVLAITEELVDLAALLLRRPSWMDDALCQEYPDLAWFPEKGQSPAEAKAVCKRCLVAEECAAYATEVGIRHGVWGGEVRSRRRSRAA